MLRRSLPRGPSRDLARRAWLLVAFTLLCARVAGAVEMATPIAAVHLEVQAAASCATTDDLAARMAVRSPRLRFLDDAAGAIAVRAEIAPGPNDTVIGQLTIVDPKGRRSARRLSAPTCAEAVDAIALIAVITLDPTYAPPAAAEAERGAVAPGPAPRSVAGTADGHPNSAAAPTVLQPGAAHRTTPTDGTEPPVAEMAPLRPAVRQLGAAAAAQLIFGPAPQVMPGLAFRIFAALDRASIWSPALRLTAAHAWLGGIREPGGTAAFALDTLGLDVCLVRLGVKMVALRGCAAGLAGRLSAAGSKTYSPSSQERPFVGVGGSAILSVAIGPHFELSGTFAASDALIRDSFEFSPLVFHRVSATTLTADLGLGLRFP